MFTQPSIRIVPLLLLVGATPLVAADQGFYGSTEIGGVLQPDLEFKNFDGGFEMNPGFRLGLEVGWRFDESFSAGVSLSGIIENVDRIRSPARGTSGNIFLDSTHEINFYQMPVLAQFRYKLPLQCPIRPYVAVGAGAVVSYLETWQEGWVWDSYVREEDVTFGYQATAGVAWSINEMLDVGVAYKFLGSTGYDFRGLETEATYSHSIVAELVVRF